MSSVFSEGTSWFSLPSACLLSTNNTQGGAGVSRPGLHRRRSRQRRGGLAWAVGPGRAVWTASGPGDRRARGQGPRTYRPRPRPRRRACWPGAARARASPPSPSCAGRPGPPGSVRTGRRSSFPQSESTVSLTAESRLVPSAWNETDCAGEAPRPPAECPGPRETGRGAGPARPCVRTLVGPARSDAPPALSHTRSVTQRTHMHTPSHTHAQCHTQRHAMHTHAHTHRHTHTQEAWPGVGA